MITQATAMVLASFVADSLSLGAHWIYDTASIDQRIGLVDTLRAPLPDSFHASKKAGQLTHYGDQALVLLQSMARIKNFSLPDFAADWENLFVQYQGYVDKATSTTLSNIHKKMLPLEQCGSNSSDLGGAARIAPLVYLYQNDQEALLDAAVQQTKFTHNNPSTLAGAQYIARSTWNVLHGQDPVSALTTALKEMTDIHLFSRIQAGLDSQNTETRTAIKAFGQVCDINAALPGAVHLVVRYGHDLKTALVENVMAGGDSAARGMVAGMILGASLGAEAIPPTWLASMESTEHIKSLLADLDSKMKDK